MLIVSLNRLFYIQALLNVDNAIILRYRQEMRKIKATIVILIAGCFVALALSGCGVDKAKEAASQGNKVQVLLGERSYVKALEAVNKAIRHERQQSC